MTMAPEQITGEPVDNRSDLFAAGAILFEMLAGRPAFSGRTIVEIVHATRYEQPPALTGSPAVAALDRVIRRALSKRPADRPSTADEMATELRTAHALDSDATPTLARALTRLVVLPFRVLRPDPETDFLAFSLADAIATSLSSNGSLILRSSAVAARFGGETPDLKALAAEADVDRVVMLHVALHGGDFASALDVRIVGIIEPALEPRYEEGVPASKVYVPVPLEPEPALTLYVRTHGAANALAQPVRELVRELAPRVPILEIGTLDEFNERSFGQQLWLARAAAIIGVIGLLLATAGLYGVSSYLVAMRSREIAIRMAIGARPQAILTMILSQSMRIAAVGLIVGAAGAAAASRVIQSGYYGIRGLDGGAFGGATALFVAAMLAASAIPARRASRLDPVENLKDT